jgi:hypothetical protein
MKTVRRMRETGRIGASTGTSRGWRGPGSPTSRVSRPSPAPALNQAGFAGGWADARSERLKVGAGGGCSFGARSPIEKLHQTLLELGADPRRLGAQLGITIVLHTWTRDLRFHAHLHCIVTDGGLHPDGNRWISARQGYLFPVKVLS